MKRNYLLTLLCLLVAVLIPNELWAVRYAKAIVYSEPTSGGFVYVTKDANNIPSSSDTTRDESSNSNSKVSSYTFTFYRYAFPKSGYEFKGWATSTGVNTGDMKSSVGISGDLWGYSGATETYYAIFARLAANVSELNFNVERPNTLTKEVIISHSHAGKITAALSGDDAGQFSISTNTPVENSVSEGNTTMIVTYNPSCSGSHEATLTISSNNELTPVTITLKGTASLQSQKLSWTEPINTNILKGTTTKIEATATSGLRVSYTSSDSTVLSIKGDTLYAKKVGSAIITAKQAGDCTYAAATSITETFMVNDKATPVFLLEGKQESDSKNLLVGETTTISISNIDAEYFEQDYKEDLLDFSLVDGVATITAKNAGTATLTLTQTATEKVLAASRTFTFNISKHIGMLTLTDKLGTAYKVDDAANVVDCYTASNDEVEVQVESSNMDVIAVVEGQLKAVGAGTATVTFKQAETYKWTALSASQEITVTKYDVSAHISQAAATWDATISNPFAIDYDLNDYTVEALDPAIATYTDGAIQTYAETGTARFVLSRPEDYKYNQLAETLSISVAPKTESDIIYQDNTQYDINYGNSHTYTVSNVLPGDILTVDFWENSGAQGGLAIYGYVNEAETEIMPNTEFSTTATTYLFTLAKAYTTIKIQGDGGGLSIVNKHCKNFTIRRNLHISADNSNVNMESTIGTNATATISLDYGSLGSIFKVVSDNPKISVSQTSFEATGNGTQEITLIGDATVLGTETATITIYDQSKKTTVNVTSTITRIPQTITWNSSFENLDVFSTVALDATASGATTVTYSIAEEDQAKAAIAETVLSFNEVGTVHVVATAAQSDIYETASDTVSVVVSLAQPVVSVLPTVVPIAYGTALTDALLQGGVAMYDESGVDGSFAWADEQITENLTPNTYSFNVRFTPADATHYSTADCTVEVTVTKANPVVSQWPTATLTYGETLAGVVLTGKSDNEGTFQWGDSLTEEDLAAVKTAETYTHEVKFVPVNNELYNTVYGLATITIQEATQEIIWENYPTLCNIGDQITLEAKASSGLPVEYFIEQNGNYATIDPETNILTALAQGSITLEVSQQGEVGKYLAADVKYITISILPKQPTNTESLNADMSPVSKVIRNGQLYILRGDKVYDASGRLVVAE